MIFKTRRKEMIKRLLNLYVKHIKEMDTEIWKRITLLPKNIIAVMMVALICFTLTILSAILANADVEIFNNAETWGIACTITYIISAIVSVFFCAIAQIEISKYEIEISDSSMNEYWAFCNNTKKWIVELFNFDDSDKKRVIKEIEIIKKRVDDYIQELNDDAEKRANRMDKWIQALAIPFILAIITAVIDKNDDISKAVAIIVSIILVGVVLFGIVWLSNNFKSLLRKQKIEQLKLFSEDLQGIIDTEHYCNIGKKS